MGKNCFKNGGKAMCVIFYPGPMTLIVFLPPAYILYMFSYLLGEHFAVCFWPAPQDTAEQLVRDFSNFF